MTLTENIEANYANIAARFEKQVIAGQVDTDPYLQGTEIDTRRGLTLIARPDIDTTQVIHKLIEELRPVLGKQYIHPSADLHTTILSVIPGSEGYAEEAGIVDACIESAEQAISSVGREFVIRYEGLIASSDSLIVKGYPAGNALQQLRKEIISQLTVRGIEQRLSRRYVMIAAHMTVVRFVSQPSSLITLQKRLHNAVNQPLGKARITHLELVENDWYMRARTLVAKGKYDLPDTAPDRINSTR